MKKFLYLFSAFVIVIALVVSASAAVYDLSTVTEVYRNTFDNISSLNEFTEFGGDWNVFNGKLYLSSYINNHAFIVYTGDEELTSLSNYVLDVDMYNVCTQGGVIVRSDLSCITNDSNGFAGYFAFISFTGKNGAIGYADRAGNWCGNLVVSDDITEQGMNLHLRVVVVEDMISYFITNLETNELLWEHHETNSEYSSGSFGFRMYTGMYNGASNLNLTSFDNLVISKFYNSPLTEGYYTYTVASGKATITDYSGKESVITVPSTLGGFPVTAIGDEAFKGCSATKITLPSGILSLGNSAFNQCEYLNEIVLPDSITTFGDYVFAGCLYLKGIDLPKNLTKIGVSTFNDCNEITKVIFPSGITEIPRGTFFAQRMILEKLYIPKSVKSIGENAFWYRLASAGVSLHKVYYEGTAEDFLKITFSEGNTQLINHDIVFGASAYLFETNGGEALDTVFANGTLNEFPTPVKDGYIFEGWYDSPEFATLITPDSPYNKGGYTVLYAKWKQDFNGLEFEAEDGKITVVAYEGTAAELTIPSEIDGLPVTAIGDNAFYTSTIEKITLPNSITHIGKNAFGLCESLSEIVFSEGLVSIANSAFQNCPALTSITLPSSVKTIGDAVFYNCDTLETFRFPDRIESIGTQLFWGCETLTDVYLPCSMPIIPYGMFYGCVSLRHNELIIPNVTEIGDAAFFNCKSLELLIVPHTVKVIGDKAFACCYNLADISVWSHDVLYGGDVLLETDLAVVYCLRGSTTATYASEAGHTVIFFTCSEHNEGVETESVTVITPPTSDTAGLKIVYCADCYLELSREVIPATEFLYTVENNEATVTKYTGSSADVTVPEMLGGYPVVAIGEEAFYSNTALKRITIPNGVRSIGAKAFDSCSALYYIDMPETLLTIGDDAFADAFADTFCSIKIPDSVTSIGDRVFADCSRLQGVEMPKNLVSMGVGTFRGCNALKQMILPEGLTSIPANTFFSSRMYLNLLYIPSSVKSIGVNAFWAGDCLGVGLGKVYYGGDAADFLGITFADGNTTLLNHKIIFNTSICSFETNGGNSINPIFVSGTLSSLPIPTKEGSAFGGWYKAKEFLGSPITAPFEMTESLSLYARWKTTPEEKMDFSDDGRLDISDVLLGLKASLNDTVTNGHDISGDGVFSLIDILRILRVVVK